MLSATYVVIGGAFVFWSLANTIFGIRPPESSAEMQAWLESQARAKFVLPTVKLVELIAGVLILTQLNSWLGTLMLTPVVFGIVASQLILNRSRGWKIASLVLFCM